MPLAEIRFGEAEGNLPDVCLRCGKRAVCRTSKTICLHDTANFYGRGVLALIGMVIDFLRYFSSSTLVLHGPFCATHRHHWAFRRTVIWGIVALIPLVLLGIALLYLVQLIGSRAASALVPGTLFFGILSATLVYGTSTIKFACNENAQILVLANVHPKFLEALEQQREAKARRQRPQRRDAVPMPSDGIHVTGRPAAHAQAGPDAFADLTDDPDEGPIARRTRRANPNHTALIVVALVGVPLLLLAVVAMVATIGKLAQQVVMRPPAEPNEVREIKKPDPAEEERNVQPGTAVPDAPPRPAPPTVLADRRSIDLIPLVKPRKDVVQGRWFVANQALHCDQGSFVPRVQFPYQPPTEYDFIVTFWQPGLRNGISLVMPNPTGGSFFWFLGSEDGQGYGFHGKRNKEERRPGLIQAKTIHTTVVQVRKGSVRALVDGKEMIRQETDFRDLTCDDWRRIHNTKFLAVACDDPTVFYYVRIVEVNGKGKPGR